jgi:hypothetical protein
VCFSSLALVVYELQCLFTLILQSWSLDKYSSTLMFKRNNFHLFDKLECFSNLAIVVYKLAH